MSQRPAATGSLGRFKAALGESPPLLWSFLYFFCLLCGYYVLRPVREAMGASSDVSTLFPPAMIGFFARHGIALKELQLQVLFTCTFLIMLALQPVYGFISDKLGRRPLLIAGFGLGAVATYPVMTALAGAQSPFTAFALMLVLLMVLSGYTSINAVVKAELFPAHIRALGVALPYAAANVVFGGTAEYVALWFKAEGLESAFYVYVSAIMAVSCLIAVRLRDTAAESLILED